MSDPAHPFSEDDLHSYVTKVAAPELKARIDEARQSNTALSAELALSEQLKPALADTAEPSPPGEFAWRRLQADIRKEQHSGTHTSRSLGGQLRVWQAAAVFLGCLALGQAAYQVWITGNAKSGYVTASQAEEKFVLAVRFAPSATAAEIGALLQGIEGRIVDGPGASGFYRVAFTSAAARDEAEPKLDGAAIIELVARE